MTSEATDIVKILIVEDYSLFRVGIATYLNSVPGFEVISQASDGDLGVIQAKRHKPDLVLMDLGLPTLNGIEATRQIKEFNPEIKVIIMTSHDNEESVIAALGAGANAYCLKDIPSDRLLEVIKTVMEGATWLDPAIASIALSVFMNTKTVSTGAAKNEHIQLGEREQQVLTLLTQGKNNAEIADILFVSVHTVKSQVSTILQKLSVTDRVQAAVKAATEGLVPLDQITPQ